MKALTANWSTFTDAVTGARFLPYLEKTSGLYIGLADVTEEQAASLKERGFTVATLEEWEAAIEEQKQAQEEAELAAAKEGTGDPLADAASASGAKRSRSKKADQAPGTEGDSSEGADLLAPPAPPASGSGE